MPKPVILPSSLRQRMFEHALASPDREVCGLLGGVQQQLTAYYPVRNIAADPGNEFLMDPVEQIGVMQQLRTTGGCVAGIFHSHPCSAAQPSALDRRLAYYPDTIYFILSLLTQPPELKAWYFDGDCFQERSIQAD